VADATTGFRSIRVDCRSELRGWEREWREAGAADRAENLRVGQEQTRSRLVLLVLLAVGAGLLAGILPLTPGYSTSNPLAAVVAAAVTAAASAAVVPVAYRLGRGLPRAGAGDLLVFTAALPSAGAAATQPVPG
jgi:VIT1/CCC1 family predicted Fe2+/Mn2+ transporter